MCRSGAASVEHRRAMGPARCRCLGADESCAPGCNSLEESPQGLLAVGVSKRKLPWAFDCRQHCG